MQHKVKVTVIDKKLYPELQTQYCQNKNAGMCSCYEVGDEFIFERYDGADDFWHMGLNTLKQSVSSKNKIAGGCAFPHYSEAWDAISRYIYTGLQGGSIMRGWMEDERVMIACCSDGTRPVIFKIERMDYKAVFMDEISNQNSIKEKLLEDKNIDDVQFKEAFIEVYLNKDIDDDKLKNMIENIEQHHVIKIE